MYVSKNNLVLFFFAEGKRFHKSRLALFLGYLRFVLLVLFWSYGNEQYNFRALW